MSIFDPVQEDDVDVDNEVLAFRRNLVTHNARARAARYDRGTSRYMALYEVLAKGGKQIVRGIGSPNTLRSGLHRMHKYAREAATELGMTLPSRFIRIEPLPEPNAYTVWFEAAEVVAARKSKAAFTFEAADEVQDASDA